MSAGERDSVPVEKFPVFHKSCGKVAFYTTRVFKYGDLIRASDVLLIAGEQPEQFAEVLCGGCGESIDFGDLTYEKPEMPE